jgi:hypothetical protein
MKSKLNFLLLLGLAVCCHRIGRPSAPVPAAHRCSADNVFYLRWYVSVPTSRGSIGLLPGQEVTLSGRGEAASGNIKVSDGRDIVEIARAALTHDIDEAATLRASDALAQESLQENLAQATQTAELQSQAAQAALADGVNASSAWMASQTTVGDYPTRLFQAAGRSTGGSYYTGTVVYPVVARAQPATSAAGASRAAAAGFTPVMTAQPAPAATRLTEPLGPTHTDPAIPGRVAGSLNQ